MIIDPRSTPRGIALFLERLDAKTGWGKVEIRELLLRSIVDAAIEYAERSSIEYAERSSTPAPEFTACPVHGPEHRVEITTLGSSHHEYMCSDCGARWQEEPLAEIPPLP